ncbi:protein of unknown function [Candidatus Filomicrobium marinum]|uniref:Uncharacterized protein n=1 Tax=Candidatus Filomicrobium marinum TaxID=1608628 RepID=A0A0D6JE96_9HYPH|nr:protein of unknown function [Candidatus Filomicrobium marinum]
MSHRFLGQISRNPAAELRRRVPHVHHNAAIAIIGVSFAIHYNGLRHTIVAGSPSNTIRRITVRRQRL